jgi:hypothetical protein
MERATGELSMNGLSHWCWPKTLLRLFQAATFNSPEDGNFSARRELWDRVAFATKLCGADEAPQLLRNALLAALQPHDAIRCLIFGPSQRTAADTKPASLLTILEHEWVVVISCQDVGALVYRCDFENTLLVEMTEILLYGKLRLSFVEDGQIQSVAIFFNTVTCDLYEEAVQLLLNGMDGNCQSTFQESGDRHIAFKDLPLKFKNAVARHLPLGQRVLAIIHSPTVLRRRFAIFWRELSPAGVLVLTDRQLFLISEESARYGKNCYETAKYGYIITYCPLSRLEAVCSKQRQFLDVIEIEAALRAGRGGLKLTIGFSHEKRAAVTAFVNSVIQRQALFRV